MESFRRSNYPDEMTKNDNPDNMQMNPMLHANYAQYQQMQTQDYMNDMRMRQNYQMNVMQPQNGVPMMNPVQHNNAMNPNNANYNNRMPMPNMVPNDISNAMPPDEQNMNYYQEYCRLYIANVVLTTQMKELVAEKNDLLTKLAKLEKRSEELQDTKNNLDKNEEKKKRSRRTASEIDRHYRCPVEICQKSYGSEGSLNQHIKLKHPEYYAIHLKGKEDEGGSIPLTKNASSPSENFERSNMTSPSYD